MAKYLDDQGLLYFWQKIKNLFAPLASPTFTGTPKAPTAASGTDTTQIATTAFVQDAVDGLVVDAYDTVVVGSTSISASTSNQLTVAAGANVQVNGNANSHIVTISATDTTYGTFTKTANGLVPMTGSTHADNNMLVSSDGGGTWMTLGDYIDDLYDVSSTATGVLKRNGTEWGAGLLDTSDIPDLSASKITSGTFAAARIPNLAASKITSGTLGVARGGTGAGTLTGIVKGNGTSAMSAATASDVVTLLGTNAVNRATADASGNNIADTYALKTEIAGMYKYKGSVAAEANLPTSGQSTGDVYNIESASSYGAAGANVAWNGTAWDSLGEIFTIANISNSDIDTIVAS